MKTGSGDTPSLTVITVCRNSAVTIAKTLESVLEQKDPGVQYLVVDGASTDGTQQIVTSYQGIDHFVSEPDRGIADAFNKGLGMASGDIIGFINSDDLLCRFALASVRRYFSEHPEVDVVHGDVLLIDGERVVKTIKPAGRWWYPWRLVLFNHPATFVRREVYEQCGLFDSSYRIAMDVEIFLRWRRRGVRVKYLPETLVSMNFGGLSSQCAEQGYREAHRAFLHHGFSPLLANLQLAGKLLVNRILSARSRRKST